MELTESKSQLVKLLSSENIMVEQRPNVSTAFFDTENRLLVVPVFTDDVSVNVLDLLLSHEVSHSLNTPNEEWKSAITELKISKSILNSVEDARIEKLIKQKYPGLKRIYHFGYKELMDIDFFGLSKLDVDELNLIDRINLYFKVGFLQFISFTEEEHKFVKAVEQAETFADVIRISKEIQEYMKQSLQQKYEEQVKLSFDGSGFGDSESIQSEVETETETEETGMDSPSNKGELDKGSENALDGGFGDYSLPSQEEYIKENLKSHTQESSEEKQKELVKEESKQSIYVDIPDFKVKDYVIDHSIILNLLRKEVDKSYVDGTLYNKFKAENTAIISYIIKEFNLKKNAQGRKKAKISKTGDINLNKLYAYKVTDDIFKRSTIVPKEQNHGLVFFLDWSGSMSSYFEDTVKQLLVLLSFCRKTNIPFEVYAFTTNWYVEGKRQEPKSPKKHGQMILYPTDLMNLYSSRMSNTDFAEMSNYLLNFDGNRFSKKPQQKSWLCYGYYENFAPQWFKLGNTPLNHTIILSTKVMEEFKARTKVQIANAVYLTDGESHGISFSIEKYYQETNYRYFHEYNMNNRIYNIYLRDKKTSETKKMKNIYNPFDETNQITSFIKQFSDFKMIAFRLIGVRDLRKNFNRISQNYDIPDTKTFNKDNCLEIKTQFDKFYFVKTNALNNDEELNNVEGKSSAVIAKEFSKVMGAKINNRVFLKKFVEVIS